MTDRTNEKPQAAALCSESYETMNAAQLSTHLQNAAQWAGETHFLATSYASPAGIYQCAVLPLQSGLVLFGETANDYSMAARFYLGGKARGVAFPRSLIYSTRKRGDFHGEIERDLKTIVKARAAQLNAARFDKWLVDTKLERGALVAALDELRSFLPVCAVSRALDDLPGGEIVAGDALAVLNSEIAAGSLLLRLERGVAVFNAVEKASKK